MSTRGHPAVSRSRPGRAPGHHPTRIPLFSEAGPCLPFYQDRKNILQGTERFVINRGQVPLNSELDGHQTSIDGRTHEQNTYIRPCGGKSHGHKEQRSADACYVVDDPPRHSAQRQYQTPKVTYCRSPRARNFQNRQIYGDRESDSWLPGVGEGRGGRDCRRAIPLWGRGSQKCSGT